MATNYQITSHQQEKLPILRVEPQSKGPLVVIVPSIFGIGPDVVEYAKAFSESGALVYAMDSFWRESPGPLPIPSGAPLAMKRMHQVNPDHVLEDLLCAIEHGRHESLCNGSVILLGICFGGQFVVKATAQTKVQGMATWHGGDLLSVLSSSDLEKVHVEMDFGDIDPLIPLSDVEKIRSALQYVQNIQIRTHANSSHGFTHKGTMKYNEEAAQQAVKGVLGLIKTCQTV